MEAQVKQFFKENPKVDSVLVVADQLFLVGFEKQASAHARQKGVEVVVAERPQPEDKTARK